MAVAVASDEDKIVHLIPKRDIQELVIQLSMWKVVPRLTIATEHDMRYMLRDGQMLVTDASWGQHPGYPYTGYSTYKIKGHPSFAMVVEYCSKQKVWKMLSIDFFYRDRLRTHIMKRELRNFGEALNFGPLKLEDMIAKL